MQCPPCSLPFVCVCVQGKKGLGLQRERVKGSGFRFYRLRFGGSGLEVLVQISFHVMLPDALHQLACVLRFWVYDLGFRLWFRVRFS